jgi:hypothetical protein
MGRPFMSAYQPKTGEECFCRRGIERDNCPTCEGTGMVIDFARVRKATADAAIRESYSCGDSPRCPCWFCEERRTKGDNL